MIMGLLVGDFLCNIYDGNDDLNDGSDGKRNDLSFIIIMTLMEAGARFLQNIYDDNDDLVSGDVGERYVPMTMM